MNQFVIDGSWLLHKVCHVFNKTDNEYIFGFLLTLAFLKEKYPNFRYNIMWGSGVEPPSFNLKGAPVEVIKKALTFLDVFQYSAANVRSVDVIASFVRKHSSDLIYIYGSDKKLLQLVSDRVIVIKCGAGEGFFDESVVLDKYGVRPESFVALCAFLGDGSSSAHSIKGVSPKLITYLVSKYKTLQAVYNSMVDEKLSASQLQSLNEFKNQAFLNYSRIELDSSIEYTETKGSVNPDAFDLFIREYKIEMVPRILDALFTKNTSFLYRQSESLALRRNLEKENVKFENMDA